MSSMQLQHPHFMIACAARTGSTRLVRTLRSHPRLIVPCEVDPARRAALEAMRFEQPERVLYQEFLDTHDAQAVGFKLKYDELVRPQWHGVRRLVEEDKELAIVFLHRRDFLRRYLSH